jgi:hypothetical protein
LCGCIASIERRRGPDAEARIAGSDRGGVVVETDRGQRRRISGSEIKEIDHPGNVLMTVGAVLAGSRCCQRSHGTRTTGQRQMGWRSSG